VAVEIGVHGTDRRRMDVGIEAGQPLPDLWCAPARFVLLQAHDLRLDLEGQLIGVAVWSARSVGQPFQADLMVAATILQPVLREMPKSARSIIRASPTCGPTTH
jgi:hypothetical protein